MMMKKRKWSVQEQAVFLKKTGELLKRGYPLADAIHSLTYQMKTNRKEEISDLLTDLKEGHPFYKILINLQFNQTLIGFVYFAEQHGSLADAFQDGSEMMIKRSEDFQKLKKIVFYPVFLILMTFFLFFFVEKILLPRYSSLFHSMNLSPNFFMNLIYFTGEILPFVFFCISVGFLILLGLYVFKFRRYSPLKQKSFLSSLPIVGSFYRLLVTHFFSIQLSYLIGGGLSILEALKLFEEHEKDTFDRELGKDMQVALMKGRALEEIVVDYIFFEKELASILKHGQENGKLDQELFFFSKHCLTTLEDKTEKVIKRVQPILYSVIGVIIVSMYLAILLPMFKLLDGF